MPRRTLARFRTAEDIEAAKAAEREAARIAARKIEFEKEFAEGLVADKARFHAEMAARKESTEVPRSLLTEAIAAAATNSTKTPNIKG